MTTFSITALAQDKNVMIDLPAQYIGGSSVEINPEWISKSTNDKTSETQAMAEDDQHLANVVQLGLFSNPEYGLTLNNRQALEQQLQQARGLYRPSLDLNADLGYEYSNNPGTRSGLGDNDETLNRRRAGVTLTQLLYNGMDRFYQNELQEARLDAASHRLRNASEQTALAIIESYLDVARQRSLLEIANENIKVHEDILGRIQDGEEAGRSTQADVQQVTARLARAISNKIQIEESLGQANAAYKRAVGELPSNVKVPNINKTVLSDNMMMEIEVALAANPNLDSQESLVDAAEDLYKQSRAPFFPTVNAQVSSTQAYDIGGIEGRDRGTSALLTLNWNLYRGGIDTAQVREQVYRYAQAKNERRNTARIVEEQVRQAWLAMEATERRKEQFERQAAANEKVVQAYLDQYELNRRTLLDVLDAQNEFFVSKSTVITNDILNKFAIYQILSLRSAVLPSLGLDYDNEINTKNFHN